MIIIKIKWITFSEEMKWSPDERHIKENVESKTCFDREVFIKPKRVNVHEYSKDNTICQFRV